MSMSNATLLTACLLSGLILAGSMVPVHAGDGCTKDKKETSTSSHWSPASSAGYAMAVAPAQR
ncbi:MAG: hypothetical protein JZU52_03610 [Lamprocystis purpurea]|jgi:hypothetical protein|uniref:hypothetical protein n=1 Tax=Lamprocystis purpurea TaxID=61598 RepID=UPI0003744704|nr:hypothetical protein [Lamprocystis purpurea]MBV5272752.1 hypothetical protein [Lamprocystis purpurea]